ncbi:MAG: T9SS type A sorting domain-containing protein [Flammeovirgaceae bacterium]
MKMKSTLLVVALMLVATGNLFAQFDITDTEDFGPATERFLGYPNTSEGTQLLPVGIDLWEGNDNNTIHYGLVPPNSSNKPVVVFVHGYASNASVFFEGDDNMYWDVYRDGYRSAFVSLTPNNHMWTNGNMLANIIDDITDHYGVDEVIVVGWSKGGVDIDAALVHFGANDKVSQAFTLSTPHFGTGIAELANSVLLSLVNIIFMQNNDATVCLQRGYMSYFRSITNNNSNNTVGYTTIGGWGNGPLARLSIPQGYLYLAGGSKASGGNDGVVPYSSSRRPGGNELFGGLVKKHGFLGIPYYEGPNETDLDHFEVTRGGLVWPYIKANINANARLASTITANDYNPNAKITSNMQIVTHVKGTNTFQIEDGAGKVTILLGQAKTNERLTLKNKQGIAIEGNILTQERLGNGAIKSSYEFNNLPKGEYTIDAEETFAAIVMTENGVEATLNTGLTDQKLVYEQGERMNFELTLHTAQQQVINQALVTGTLHRTTDLALNRVDDEPLVIAFDQTRDGFHTALDANLPEGIYQIMVKASGNGFTKHVVTSIAITRSATGESIIEEPTQLSIANAYPNPSYGELTIELSGVNKQSSLTVFNIFGQEIKQFDLSNQVGNAVLTWNTSKEQLEGGIYILQFTDGKQKVTKKVMIK